MTNTHPHSYGRNWYQKIRVYDSRDKELLHDQFLKALSELDLKPQKMADMFVQLLSIWLLACLARVKYGMMMRHSQTSFLNYWTYRILGRFIVRILGWGLVSVTWFTGFTTTAKKERGHPSMLLVMKIESPFGKHESALFCEKYWPQRKLGLAV